MRFKKRLGVYGVILALIGTMLGCTTQTSGTNNSEIKIGVLFSKSGALAITEESMYNAAMLAIDDSNQHVWVQARIGRVNDQGLFEVVYESPEPIQPQPPME